MQANMQQKNYWGPIKGLGSWALIAFIIGLIFTPLSRLLFSEELQNEVIVQAIPFVAIFAGILLLFILSIALLSLRFHLSIPNRTHKAVEFTIIAGILAGIVFLFQPWFQVAYRHGFIFLLFATLAFIVWSHVMPRSSKDDKLFAPFEKKAVTAGMITGLIVAALVFGNLALTSQPKEPYGMRQRRFDLLEEAQKAEITLEALRDYRFVHLPYFALYSLFPAFISFFIVRELSTPKQKSRSQSKGL